MERIRSEIAGQEVHEAIPSDREISQQLNISRMTVRRAADELCRQGGLYRDGSRGTFVAASHAKSEPAARHERQRVLFLDSICAAANVKDVRQAFRLEEGGRLFRMGTRRCGSRRSARCRKRRWTRTWRNWDRSSIWMPGARTGCCFCMFIRT